MCRSGSTTRLFTFTTTSVTSSSGFFRPRKRVQGGDDRVDDLGGGPVGGLADDRRAAGPCRTARPRGCGVSQMPSVPSSDHVARLQRLVLRFDVVGVVVDAERQAADVDLLELVGRRVVDRARGRGRRWPSGSSGARGR